MTLRRLRIEWSPDQKVTGFVTGPRDAAIGVLLAHGAGAGQRHPFMVGIRDRLAEAGYLVMTFDYPYVEAGRRAPDRLDRLLECHAAAHARIAERVDRVVVAGKSMGGRVGGHLVAERDHPAHRLVYFGYPLISIGSTTPRATDHIEAVAVPQLFIQGERDRLGPPAAISEVARRCQEATVEVIADADHGFRVPKRTGLEPDDVLDVLAATAGRFVAR